MKNKISLIYIFIFLLSLGCASHFERAGRLQREGKGQEAILEYQKVIEKSQKRDEIFEAHKNLGDLYSQKDPYRAIEHYRHALEFQPNDPIINEKIGELFAQKEEESKALYYYEKAEDLTVDRHEKVRIAHQVELLNFKIAQQTDTIEAWEMFLEKYPESEFAPEAEKRLEELYFEKAKMENTIEGYWLFVQKYPQSKFAGEAERLAFENAKSLNTIEAYEEFIEKFPQSDYVKEAERGIVQLALPGLGPGWQDMEFLVAYHPTVYNESSKRKILRSVRSILPPQCKAEVEVTVPREGLRVVVKAHLLEGVSCEDKNPDVRGYYLNRQLLENLVKKRVAKIYRAVFTALGDNIPSEVVVECKHGVRYYYRGTYAGGGQDRCITIFKTLMVEEDSKKISNWKKAKASEIEKIWTVRENVIPDLEVKGF